MYLTCHHVCIASPTRTVYGHFTQNPSTNSIVVRDDISFDHIDRAKGYTDLEITFLPTDDIDEIIIKNINQRSGNISKFYGWLEVNAKTPIEVKLLILDNCLFSSILYGIEALGNFECVHDKLLQIKMSALKSILKVKKGTSTDLVHFERRRPNIISRIKDIQHKFFERIVSIDDESAIVKSFIRLCDV